MAALVVLEPHKLVDRQGIQPRAYLPDALLVVAGDRQAAVRWSGRLYDPRRLFGTRLLGVPGRSLGAARGLLDGLRPLFVRAILLARPIGQYVSYRGG